MRLSLLRAVALSFVLVGPAEAATITFATDPFEGSTALTTPGRQVVGGEQFVPFSPATDQFVFDLAAFASYGFGAPLVVANGAIGDIPTTGVNVVVLRTFDSDNDPATPFNAGTAANLIADRVTAPGAGVFVYFNSNLDLARLVFSTDLNDNTADLKILARLTNFTGADGRAAMADLSSTNFAAAVPEPSGLLLVVAGLAVRAGWRRAARSAR